MNPKTEEFLEDALIRCMPWDGVIAEICWELAASREAIKRLNKELEDARLER